MPVPALAAAPAAAGKGAAAGGTAAGTAATTAAATGAAAAPAATTAAVTPAVTGAAAAPAATTAAVTPAVTGAMTAKQLAVPAAIAAGGRLASGLAQALLTDQPEQKDPKVGYANAGPGQVGAKTNIGNVFTGRPDIAGPQPRNSLAMQLLQRRG